jgi:translation initiation factor IF-2
MPVKITGLSDLAEAGCEFIVVQNEKTARELAYARQEGHKASQLKQTKKSIDIFMEKKKTGEKKILPIIIKADVQGSLEALKSSLAKIKSEKVELNIVGEGIGEIAESDIQLAAASKAVIIGFHTQMESHAESLIKQCQITVKEGEIIYHLIDDVKALMKSLLNKIEQEIDRGSVLVKAIFKSSQYGIIAGCVVQDGFVNRNHFVRILRNKEIIHKGKITSLKRQKDDVKEVQKGIECGIVIDGFNTIKEGDIIQTYDITYLEQDL